MDFEIKFLDESLDLKVLTNTFNDAFSDYVIKFIITEESLVQKINGENIALKYSSGVFDKENNLVGFILHAIDSQEKYLYNAATGVVPSSRGRKLVQEEYKMMVPIFKEKGIQSVILEVISTNERAIKVYNSCGFKTKRMVSSYKGDLKKESLARYLNNLVTIKEVTSGEIGGDLVSFVNQYSDCKPSYSNTIDCIQREFTQKYNRCWTAYSDDTIVGFISIHALSRRIRQVLVHPDFRNKNIGTTLVYKMIQDINDDTNLSYNIANIDQSYTPLLNFFSKRIELPYFLSQREMELAIE